MMLKTSYPPMICVSRVINSFMYMLHDTCLSITSLYHAASGVSLRMVMTFFSGAEVMPPMGYPHDPEINFNDNSPYPTSSTCALQLTLPTCYSEYSKFKHALDTAFTMHGGFGLS